MDYPFIMCGESIMCAEKKQASARKSAANVQQNFESE